MPAGQPDPSETYVDRIIREAMEAGDFDDLPGEGKPIPGAGTARDDLWWVREWIKRNQPGDDDHPSTSSE
ncbi:MAG TPA: DUF1992 domain-containing protein [Acidimicrobiia bacterium]|jgi:hypothetical protein